MNKTMTRIFQVGLIIFALGLFAFSIIYWVRLISENLWEDTSIRIIIMVLTIGAIVCVSLARVIYNQGKILECLDKR